MRYVFDIEDEVINKRIQDLLSSSEDELRQAYSSFATICLHKIAVENAGGSIPVGVEINPLTFAPMLFLIMAEIKRRGKKIAESN